MCDGERRIWGKERRRSSIQSWIDIAWEKIPILGKRRRRRRRREKVSQHAESQKQVSRTEIHTHWHTHLVHTHVVYDHTWQCFAIAPFSQLINFLSLVFIFVFILYSLFTRAACVVSHTLSLWWYDRCAYYDVFFFFSFTVPDVTTTNRCPPSS